jgi:hypothetical protein
MVLRVVAERAVLTSSRSGDLRAMSGFFSAGFKGKASLLDDDLGLTLSLLGPLSFA